MTTTTSTAVPEDTGLESWRIDRVMAEAAEAGAFGPGVRFVSFATDGPKAGLDQFCSVLRIGTLTVRDDDAGVDRDFRLVLKFKHRTAAMRELFANDMQFRNETLFYERIAPYLLDRVPVGVDPSAYRTRVSPLCRYLYGRNDCGDRGMDDLIVLENVTDLGYRMSSERWHLDFDHLVVALRTLAKFHGLSYRAKHEDLTGFIETIAGIEEPLFNLLNKGEWFIGDANFVALFSVILDRLAKRRGGVGDEYERRLRALFLDDPTGKIRRVLRPDEPLAVLCHGDFNSKNLMFRYDATSGRPVDALPLDFGIVWYGSPALDLSFFLYMNTDRRTRERHWDALLDEYCAVLSASVSDVARDAAVPVLDRARLDAEMRDRGVYGLAIVSYMMLIVVNEQLTFDPVALAGLDGEGFRALASQGGDRATDLVADKVQHFLDYVCVATADARNLKDGG